LVLFAPHAEEESLELYYQRAHNTKLYDLLDSAAHVMGASLSLEATFPSYRAAYDAKKAEMRGRARKMWFKMRIAVRCGWVKSGSDTGQGGQLSLVGPALTWFKAYLNKFKGAGMASPPRADLNTITVTFAGSFLGVGSNALIHFYVFAPAKGTDFGGFEDWQFNLMSGSFGALACLLYAMPLAPFSQPKMVICGHILALSVAVACDYFVNTRFATAFVPTWLMAAITPALAISGMALTGCINPPAAAASLIYATGNATVKGWYWWFLFFPNLVGCVVMLIVAVLVNNLSAKRKYPQFWW